MAPVADRREKTAALLLYLLRRRKNRRLGSKEGRLWSKRFLINRSKTGAYTLCKELSLNDIPSFSNFARMYPSEFADLERKICPLIQRQNTNYRRSISAGERLMLTLRFLATGESYIYSQKK